MSEPMVHLVVTVVADQEGTALRGEVVVFVGSETMHREPLDLADGPYELQRAALVLHELGLEALDVHSATNGDAASPSPATDSTPKQRAPRRRSGQAPAKVTAQESEAAQGAVNNVRVVAVPSSRRR